MIGHGLGLFWPWAGAAEIAAGTVVLLAAWVAERRRGPPSAGAVAA